MRIIFLLALLFISNITLGQGICARIEGTWQGTFKFKKIEDCKKYGGCVHGLAVKVSRYDGVIYQAVATPNIGQTTSFKVKCEDGIITLPDKEFSQVTFYCKDVNICYVVYDSVSFYANIHILTQQP